MTATAYNPDIWNREHVIQGIFCVYSLLGFLVIVLLLGFYFSSLNLNKSPFQTLASLFVNPSLAHHLFTSVNATRKQCTSETSVQHP